jgi:hypothetical protein
VDAPRLYVASASRRLLASASRRLLASFVRRLCLSSIRRLVCTSPLPLVVSSPRPYVASLIYTSYAVALPRMTESRTKRWVMRSIASGSLAPHNHGVSGARRSRAPDTPKKVLPPCRRQSRTYRQVRRMAPHLPFMLQRPVCYIFKIFPFLFAFGKEIKSKLYKFLSG